MVKTEPGIASAVAGKRPSLLDRLERAVRPLSRDFRWLVKEPLLAWRDPEALAFYKRVMAVAYLPNDLIDVSSDLGVLYLAVPKAASSRIRSALAAMIGRDTISDWHGDTNWKVHSRKASYLQAPRHSVRTFHHVATNRNSLKFTFVRNPYSRLVSCWADQYRGHPLVATGYGMVETYLAHRERVNPALPAGADKTLSFPEFVEFATATATERVDKHWHIQADLIDLPGIHLDLIGKVETYATDFTRVLDHARADQALRDLTIPPFHTSERKSVAEYFPPGLADRVYRAYERDFDRLGYPRAVSA